MNSTVALTAVVAIALMLQSPQTALAQSVGTSCADCANYSGAFSIENHTGVAIEYSIRWGKARAWKEYTLNSGNTMTHSYPLGEDRNAKIQPPYINFIHMQIGRVVPKEYKLRFHAVGYRGYPAGQDPTQPKRYYFEYDGPARLLLDLYAR